MSWLFEKDTLENWAYYDKLFTPNECQKIIDIGNKKKKIDAAINDSLQINYDVRKNKIAWLDDSDDISWVYEKLSFATINLNEKYFKFNLHGFTEKLQFTEYNAPDNKYIKHIDRGIGFSIRKLSIVVQLTDPEKYQGGDLELYYQNDPVIATKEQGTLIAFPSYTLHQITPIIKGKRNSLVTWISGAPFK